MTQLAILCRTASFFKADGGLDEDVYREHISRFVDQKIGACPGTGGAGEGHTMSAEEYRQLYKATLAVCQGRVPVFANPAEHHSPSVMIERALLAKECGVDAVNIYQSAGWHNYQATDAEHIAYFDQVLSAVKFPVVLAPNPGLGASPKPAILASVCNKYSQVFAISLVGVTQNYVIEVKERLAKDIDIYLTTRGSLEMFSFGIKGIIGSEMNTIPKTFRRYVSLYEQGCTKEAFKAYAEILKLIQYISKWNHTNSRPIRMILKVLKLPGGENRLRPPNLLPDDAELQQFTEGLIKLGLPEINDMALAAGLRVPQ